MKTSNLYALFFLSFGCFLNPYKQLNSQIETQKAQTNQQQTAMYEQNLDAYRKAYQADPSTTNAIAFAMTVEFNYHSARQAQVQLNKEALLSEARGYLAKAKTSTPIDTQRLAAEEGFLLIVFGEKVQAQSLLEKANQPQLNPYSVPYLSFIYDEKGKTQEVVSLCKQALTATKDEDLRFSLVETCYHFTRTKTPEESAAWLTKSDLEFYQKKRAQYEAEIAKNAQEQASKEQQRCDERAALYDNFSNKGARDSALDCSAAQAAASSRYVSSTEIILQLAPRTFVIKNSCAKPASLYIGPQAVVQGPTDTLQPGAQLEREAQGQYVVMLMGAPQSAASTIPISGGVRGVEVHSNCMMLQPY